MRICIVGGIFGKGPDYVVSQTPETVLASALKARGHVVFTAGHSVVPSYSTFDLVHVHHLGRGAIAAALDRSQTPLVFTPHNAARGFIERAALNYVQKRADAVVDLAAPPAGGRGGQWGESHSARCVIPNGVPTDEFHARTPARPQGDEPFRLLYAGQLIPMKRVDLLIDAVHLLRSSHNLHLDLAYHVNDELLRLRRQVERLGLTGFVTFRGSLDHTTLGNAYRAAHAVILPTEGDYLPGVLTEAMMCGTPVVSSDVGAIREQVGEFGILVPPGDAKQLAEAIQRMIREYDSYRRLSRDMAESARRRYSVDASVDAHERLYDRIVRGNGPVRRRLPRGRSIPVMLAFHLHGRRSSRAAHE